MANVAVCVLGSFGYDRAAQGVAGAGRALAESLGGELHALVVGPAEDGAVAALSAVADRVLIGGNEELRDVQPEQVLQAAEQLHGAGGGDYVAVLLSNDTYSQEIAPRLAYRLGGSSMADAAAIRMDGDHLLAQRTAYGGKAISIYRLKKQPSVVWLRARGFEPAPEQASAGEVTSIDLALDAPRIRITGREVAEQEGVRLEDAQIIVSGGRGLGGPEPFQELRRLANTIGAEQGASRAACDAGWVPPNWQVGQTGKKVAPELYIAIAISGASQHLLGMGDSKVVAAINTDADAPIFKHCSFGIVEDYKQVVPLLTEKLQALAG
ncbi:MAG: electron transfer flavoprotein subunit alpha/FixB family protein [Acidobacteria bacterium]|nr:electron transfer flavoprotein subunit alpha/FixB family protein [Acidobacteriota bacterium]